VQITKEQQIADRRQAVLELSAQGHNQQEIANKLVISQKTVSNDLAWLREDAVEFVRKNREQIAFEYRQVISNFYQLRKLAWNHYHSTASEGIKIDLYSIISNINNNVMSILSAGDLIETELLEKSKEQVKEREKELGNIANRQSSEAVF
jgi:predicted transcriptional regulator